MKITREEKLEAIAKIFAKNMFYGNWEWETPNERVITMLMTEVGLYPFSNEDEMIKETKVDEVLYDWARIDVPSRRPKTDNMDNGKVQEKAPNSE